MGTMEMIMGVLVFLVTIFAGFILLPIGVLLLCSRRCKWLGCCFLLTVVFFMGIFVHDLCAHFMGMRVWVAVNDMFLPEVFGNGSGDGVLLSMPLRSGNRLEFNLQHVRRGTYALDMWIPERIRDFVSERRDVHFCIQSLW